MLCAGFVDYPNAIQCRVSLQVSLSWRIAGKTREAAGAASVSHDSVDSYSVGSADRCGPRESLPGSDLSAGKCVL